MKAYASLLAILLLPLAGLLLAPHGTTVPHVSGAGVVNGEVVVSLEAADDASHVLRVVINNTGAAGKAILRVEDSGHNVVALRTLELASGERRELRFLGNPTTYMVDLKLPIAEAVSHIDLAQCPRTSGEVDFETSAGLLKESIRVDHRCLAGKA